MLMKIYKYDLVASQEIISPDGYTKLGMVINGVCLFLLINYTQILSQLENAGQYPGPTIEAGWGDTLRKLSLGSSVFEN